MQGVKHEEIRDTIRPEHWTSVLFDTCVTNETRPGNQTGSNQINTLVKALGLEKALGLAELVENPSLPELSGVNWERGELGSDLGTRRAVQRRTWSRSQASCLVVPQADQSLYRPFADKTRELNSSLAFPAKIFFYFIFEESEKKS